MYGKHQWQDGRCTNGMGLQLVRHNETNEATMWKGEGRLMELT
jgi:hypothetical protein